MRAQLMRQLVADASAAERIATSNGVHRTKPSVPAARTLPDVLAQLHYSPGVLSPVLAPSFVELSADEATEAFLERSLYDHGTGWGIVDGFYSMAKSVLGNFYGHADVLAMLNMGRMHLLSAPQLNTLLRASYSRPSARAPALTPEADLVRQRPELLERGIVTVPGRNPTLAEMFRDTPAASVGITGADATDHPVGVGAVPGGNGMVGLDEYAASPAANPFPSQVPASDHPVDPTGSDLPCFGSLLDVGAGDGAITAHIAPLFRSVSATEVAPRMCARLAERGYTVHEIGDIEEGLPADARFDTVTLFNVIDRCDKPRSLLEAARRRLRTADSRLVVATPLPLVPSRETTPGTWVKPSEKIVPAVCSCQLEWADALAFLVRDVIAPAGLELKAVARVPYLSEGSARRPYYVLDDAVLVLSAAQGAATVGADAEQRAREMARAASNEMIEGVDNV